MIPDNISIKFETGAKLLINPSVDVTINGPIQATLRQIFAGEGGLTIAKGPVCEWRKRTKTLGV